MIDKIMLIIVSIILVIYLINFFLIFIVMTDHFIKKICNKLENLEKEAKNE